MYDNEYMYDVRHTQYIYVCRLEAEGISTCMYKHSILYIHYTVHTVCTYIFDK
jgi:hypothetical protein